MKAQLLFLRMLLCLFVFFGFASQAFAALDLTSANFRVRDPLIVNGSGFGSSGSFRLFTSTDQVLTGINSSGSFNGRFGFLYFPYVTRATVTPTAGPSQVSLSWTTSTAGLGFSVSGYEVGVSSTSGSGYTFTNVGNVTNHTESGLTNGTTYYFVVRTLDAFGHPIATSLEVSAIPNGTVTPPNNGSSASGGLIRTGVQFNGYAYPNASIHILKNAQEKAMVIANAQGVFSATLEEQYDQNALYTLYAVDIEGNRSLLLNYPSVIISGRVTQFNEVKFPPTLLVDKFEAKLNGTLGVSGYSLPNAITEFLIEGINGKKVQSFTSPLSGKFIHTLSLSTLPPGDYVVRAHYPNDSRYTRAFKLSIGAKDSLVEGNGPIPGDCNRDNIINLRDFSVLAFWYQKPNPPACVDTNGDRIVNLIDFSIIAYYWNG